MLANNGFVSQGSSTVAGNFTVTGILSASNLFGYPFPGNATSTQLAFNGGATFAGATSTSFAVTGSTTIQTLNLSNALGIAFGGTGTSTAPAYGQLLLGDTNGAYELVSTSSLGIQSGTNLSFTYPLINTANTISLGFGTTTANTFSQLQQFNGGATTTALTITGTASTTNLIVSNLGGSGTNCVQVDSQGHLSSAGAACGTGSGSVNSVTNSDGTLVFSPTTGSVVGSLNLNNANNWTALQTFGAGIITNASSTFQNFTALNATTSQATTTNLAITGVTNTLLKTLSNGAVVAATAGVDYQAAGNYDTFGYLFPSNATSTQLAFNGGATFTGATTTALAVTGSTTLAKLHFTERHHHYPLHHNPGRRCRQLLHLALRHRDSRTTQASSPSRPPRSDSSAPPHSPQ